MKDITTRTKIGINWSKLPIDNRSSGKPISRPNRSQDRTPFKCHKCGSKSHLANVFPKKKRINEIEIENTEESKKKDLTVNEKDSEPSEEEELPDELSKKTNNVSFEVPKIHTHLPQYSA
ncbi:hypothetical protein O181_015033 [Austropuccinia psidii MF-1]|uniref:Uncharacterized protein n=1 Tax=Austropuccinia psidii MF-1 TaxID=1389203 RepID=A0A9Q3C2D2_9BASI|nr:hypothetical protein [Austropuccinia psidii MF-1]